MLVGVGAALVIARTAAPPVEVDPARLRLLEQPIFTGLPAQRIEAAARRLVPIPVVAGQSIIREGEPANRFYVIEAGSYRVTQRRDGADVDLRVLEGGAVFGEIGLLRGVPRTASVAATTDGLLYALDAEAFGELVGSGPGLRSRLLDMYHGSLSR
jgi:CRP-like cAMP-binding protein